MDADQDRTDQILARFYFNFDGSADIKPVGPDWLIKGILEAGTIVQLFGTWAAYKTFVALDMALSIATGEQWHGHDIMKPGPVIFIAGEGRGKLNNRVLAWSEIHGEVPPGCFGLSSTPTQILDPDYYDALRIRIDEISQKHGVEPHIFLDTMSRNFGPGNENTAEDMGTFLSLITMLCPSALRFVVHHTGHGNTDRGRASSVWPAGLDGEIRCEAADAGQTRLVWTKVKDGPYPHPVHLRPEVIPLGTDKQGDPITSVVMRRGADVDTKGMGDTLKNLHAAIRGEVLRLVKLRSDNGQAPGSVTGTWVDLNSIKSDNNAGRHFTRDLKKLEDRGLVQIFGEKIFLTVDSELE